MTKRSSFVLDLITEVRKWTEQGIISTDQRNRIESLYLPESEKQNAAAQLPAVKKNAPVNVVGVIIALASLCLGVGIIIFYAANWRKMPPSLKLIQVFFLIAASYGASWWFMTTGKSRLLGRAFLLIGMVCYGAGIMLVAQIYHISSHPTNGLMAWGIGVLLLSILMKERFGYYLASLLFFIWNSWEFSVFDSPAYFYPVIVAFMAFFYLRMKDQVGLFVSVILLLYYYFQTLGSVFSHSFGYGSFAEMSILMLPLGVFLYSAGKLLHETETGKPLSAFLLPLSWLFLIYPFMAVSWPGKMDDMPALVTFSHHPFVTASYISFFAGAAALSWFSLRDKRDILIQGVLLITALAMFFVPFESTQARMVSMHLSIIILFFTLLFFSHIANKRSLFDTAFAFIFAFAVLIVKGIGFSAVAMFDGKFRVAYLAGFIIFGIVCLLMNSLAARLVRDRGKDFYSGILHALSAVMIWIAVYLASFEMGEQKSVLNADTVVLVMIGIFSIIAVALFGILVSKLRENKTIIYLAGAVFAVSLVCLFTASPGTPWAFYSVMFNLLLIAISAVYIYYSTVIQSKALLNIMIIAFVVHIFTRYFDLFWDMLSGSVLFIATGIIGLAGGYFIERKRRLLTKKMTEKAVQK